MDEKIANGTKFLFQTLQSPVVLIGSMAIDLHYKNQKQDQTIKYKQTSLNFININSIVYQTSQQDVDFIGYAKDFIDLRNDFPLFCVNRFNYFYSFYFENIQFDFFTDQFHKIVIDTDICISNMIEINQLPVLSLPCLLALKIQSANHEIRSQFGKGQKDIEDIIHIIFLSKNFSVKEDFLICLKFIKKDQIDFVLKRLKELSCNYKSITNICENDFYLLKNESINFLEQLKAEQ